MAILNPDHLFEQADKLVSPSTAGRPRQVDLRRARSSAYYGLFHYCPIAASDEFVGITQRTTSRYSLVYRGIDHKTRKDLCDEVKKRSPAANYLLFFPLGGFDTKIQDFSAAAISSPYSCPSRRSGSRSPCACRRATRRRRLREAAL